jgi:hypothetical protein
VGHPQQRERGYELTIQAESDRIRKKLRGEKRK